MSNEKIIDAVENLFSTMDLYTKVETKMAAIKLCDELGDETGDVRNDLLERCYGTLNLMGFLWDAADEGNNYDCTMEDIKAFIDNRMDDGQFEAFATSEDVLVDDDSRDGWVHEFKIWLDK